MTPTGNGTGNTIRNRRAPIGPLREARRAAGLTQQQLADRACCSVDYVRLLERGFSPRYSDVWPRILEALAATTPLAARRQAVGLTRQQLAFYSNLPEETLARLESGDELPNRTMAEQLASALQTSVDVIFPRNESSPAARPSSTKTGAGGQRGGS